MEIFESPSTIFEAIIKPFVNIIQAQQDKIENVHLVCRVLCLSCNIMLTKFAKVTQKSWSIGIMVELPNRQTYRAVGTQ
jgi:hypothetical protein